MSLELIHPASPRRAVDWRWRIAARLRRGLPVDCRWVDAWVERAATFQEAMDARDDDPRHPDPAGLDPAIAAAYGLHVDGDQRLRWRVEALLLAGEGDDAIAGRCGIPADAVAAYAGVFFDVRCRLGQESYILHQAINVNQTRPEHVVGRVWKLLGYSGGPVVVDFMAAGAGGTGGIESFTGVGPTTPQDPDARLRRLAVATLTLELDPTAARRLWPLIGALEAVDEAKTAAASRPIDGAFAAMVADLDRTPLESEWGDEGDSVAQGGMRMPEEDSASSHRAGDRVDGYGAPLRDVGS